MDALAFLEKPAKAKRQPIYVLIGDEDLLKRRCREAIVKLAIGDGDPEFAISTYSGDAIDLSAVRNDLETLPFFCAARVVVVERADEFVSQNRDGLERMFAAPSEAGVLVLDVKSFPATTKLAKALPDAAKLVCEAPKPHKLPEWCVGWSKTAHGKALGLHAAAQLVELVGPSMGLLVQELAKLAVAVGDKPEIAPADVERYIKRTSNAYVFAIVDAIGNGQPAEALTLLSRLHAEGDHPLAILGAITSQLRKLANVGRLLSQGHSEGAAMDAAKIPNFPQARQNAAKQVRHLGRRRLSLLPDWLVEINVGMKGESPLPNELQLERLIVKLARPRVAAAKDG